MGLQVLFNYGPNYIATYCNPVGTDYLAQSTTAPGFSIPNSNPPQPVGSLTLTTSPLRTSSNLLCIHSNGNQHDSNVDHGLQMALDASLWLSALQYHGVAWSVSFCMQTYQASEGITRNFCKCSVNAAAGNAAGHGHVYVQQRCPVTSCLCAVLDGGESTALPSASHQLYPQQWRILSQLAGPCEHPLCIHCSC